MIYYRCMHLEVCFASILLCMKRDPGLSKSRVVKSSNFGCLLTISECHVTSVNQPGGPTNLVFMSNPLVVSFM